MPHRVVAQPCAYVAVDTRLVLAVCPPEALDGPKPLRTRCGADTTQQLIEMHEDKGERGSPYVAPAHGGAPREVTAQLAVAHCLVGGEVVLKGAVVDHVVRIVFHKLRLPQKHEGLRLGARLGGGGYPAHLANLLWQVGGHLGPAADDWLVREGAPGKGAVGLCAGAGQDAIDDALDILRHGRLPAPPVAVLRPVAFS